MALTVLSQRPTSITAGDQVAWEFDGSSYPAADGWVVRLYLSGPATQVNVVISGNEAVLSSAQTAALNTGETDLVWYGHTVATLAGERITLDTFQLMVKPNPASVTGTYDGRTTARKIADEILAVIQGRASHSETYYMIAGRQINHLLPKDQRAEYNAWKAVADAEDAAADRAAGRTTKNYATFRTTIGAFEC